MAKLNYAIEDCIAVPGRGFRFATVTGIHMQFGSTDAGVFYRNDAGYPIPWAVYFGSVDRGERFKLTNADIRVVNSLASANPAQDAQPVRLAVLRDDGRAGKIVYLFDRPAEQQLAATPVGNKVRMQRVATLPGSRFAFAVGARSAAQEIQKLEIDIEEIGGGQGN